MDQRKGSYAWTDAPDEECFSFRTPRAPCQHGDQRVSDDGIHATANRTAIHGDAADLADFQTEFFDADDALRFHVQTSRRILQRRCARHSGT